VQCGLKISDGRADQEYRALAYNLRKDAMYDNALLVVC
jgi:hypothetical protein